MSKQLTLLLQVLVLLATVVYSLIMLARMPAIVPTHWGISGKPDAYGSPTFILWLMPGVEVFILILTLALPVLSPKRYEVTRFARTYGYAMFLVTLLMAVMHFVIVDAAGGAKVDMSRVMGIVMFAFFMGIGNVLGKVKQNFFMGVRTPWTLADGRVWDQTHREAGHLWLLGGLMGLILSLCGVNIMILMVWLVVMAFIPVIRSFVIYRKVVGVGEG